MSGNCDCYLRAPFYVDAGRGPPPARPLSSVDNAAKTHPGLRAIRKITRVRIGGGSKHRFFGPL